MPTFGKRGKSALQSSFDKSFVAVEPQDGKTELRFVAPCVPGLRPADDGTVLSLRPAISIAWPVAQPGRFAFARESDVAIGGTGGSGDGTVLSLRPLGVEKAPLGKVWFVRADRDTPEDRTYTVSYLISPVGDEVVFRIADAWGRGIDDADPITASAHYVTFHMVPEGLPAPHGVVAEAVARGEVASIVDVIAGWPTFDLDVTLTYSEEGSGAVRYATTEHISFALLPDRRLGTFLHTIEGMKVDGPGGAPTPVPPFDPGPVAPPPPPPTPLPELPTITVSQAGSRFDLAIFAQGQDDYRKGFLNFASLMPGLLQHVTVGGTRCWAAWSTTHVEGRPGLIVSEDISGRDTFPCAVRSAFLADHVFTNLNPDWGAQLLQAIVETTESTAEGPVTRNVEVTTEGSLIADAVVGTSRIAYGRAVSESVYRNATVKGWGESVAVIGIFVNNAGDGPGPMNLIESVVVPEVAGRAIRDLAVGGDTAALGFTFPSMAVPSATLFVRRDTATRYTLVRTLDGSEAVDVFYFDTTSITD